MKHLQDTIYTHTHKEYVPRRPRDRRQDADSLPDREAMRPRRGYWKDKPCQSFNGIDRWLASNCGRSWNNVYSDLCKNLPHWAAESTVDRLVEKFPAMQDGVAYFQRAPGILVCDYYVDAQGILRNEKSPKWSKMTAAPPDSYTVKDGGIVTYLTADGIGYRPYTSKSGLPLPSGSYLWRPNKRAPFVLRKYGHSYEACSEPSWGHEIIAGPFKTIYAKKGSAKKAG